MTTSFTIAFWCILASVFIPIVTAAIAKKHGFTTPKDQGGYDNNHPREWMAQQTGASSRANAAQNNTFEAIPLFYAAVIIAHYLNANQMWIDILAVSWVLLRILYVVCYVKDWANARSMVWFAALGTSIAILLLGV